MPSAIDNRNIWRRLFIPSRDFGRGWVNKTKIVGWSALVIGSVAGVVVGALGIAGAFTPSFVVTIDQPVGGNVIVPQSQCVSSEECAVRSGGDLAIEIVAEDGYKLVRIDCEGCVNKLEQEATVEIQDIKSPLTITPIFQPTATVTVNANGATDAASCTVLSDEYRGGTCAEVSGGAIELSAAPEIPAERLSFEMWRLSSDAWAQDLDLTQPTITVIAPDSLETLEATAVYSGSVVLTIVNDNQGVDFAQSDIPSHYECSNVAETIRCVFKEDDRITLRVVPDLSDDTRRFRHWKCEGGSCGAQREIGALDRLFILTNEPLGGDMTVTPVFEDIVFTALTLDGALGGSVSADCEQTNNCTRESGWRTNVTATPEDGYRFANWDCIGDSCPRTLTPNPLRLTLNSDVTLAPIFEEIATVALIIGTSPNGSAEADCGSECDQEPDWHATVTATAEDGYQFANWECIGDSCPRTLTTNPLRLTLNSDVTLTPIFEEIATVALTIGTSPNGSAEADCGSDCDQEPDWRTTVTATPDDGYQFVSWDCNGDSCPSSRTTNPLRLTLNSDVTLTPIFEEVATASLTIGASPNGSAEADCESDCDREPGWTTTVTATANDGYQFASWGCTGDSCPSSQTANPLTLTVDDNIVITAIFEEMPPTTPQTQLNIGLMGGGGYITSARGRMGDERSYPDDCRSNCSYDFNQGSLVRISARPRAFRAGTPDLGRWVFEKWVINSGKATLDEGDSLTDPFVDLIINGEEVDITAVFRPAVLFSFTIDEFDSSLSSWSSKFTTVRVDVRRNNSRGTTTTGYLAGYDDGAGIGCGLDKLSSDSLCHLLVPHNTDFDLEFWASPKDSSSLIDPSRIDVDFRGGHQPREIFEVSGDEDVVAYRVVIGTESIDTELRIRID